MYFFLDTPGFLSFINDNAAPPSPQPPITKWWATPKIYQQMDFKEDFEIETYTTIPSSRHHNYKAHGLFLFVMSEKRISVFQGKIRILL